MALTCPTHTNITNTDEARVAAYAQAPSMEDTGGETEHLPNRP